MQVMEKEPTRPRTVDRTIDRDGKTIVLKCLAKGAVPGLPLGGSVRGEELGSDGLAGQSIRPPRVDASPARSRCGCRRATPCCALTSTAALLGVLVCYFPSVHNGRQQPAGRTRCHPAHRQDTFRQSGDRHHALNRTQAGACARCRPWVSIALAAAQTGHTSDHDGRRRAGFSIPLAVGRRDWRLFCRANSGRGPARTARASASL